MLVNADSLRLQVICIVIPHRKQTMTLTPPESRPFFEMYLPLLHYAYSSRHRNVTYRQFESLKIEERLSAQEILFDNMDLIDKHIADNRFTT